MKKSMIDIFGMPMSITFVPDPIQRNENEITDDRIDVTCDHGYTHYNGSLNNKIMMNNNRVNNIKELYNILCCTHVVPYVCYYNYETEIHEDRNTMKCTIDIFDENNEKVDTIIFYLVGTPYRKKKVIEIICTIEQCVNKSQNELSECQKKLDHVIIENSILKLRLSDMEESLNAIKNNYDELIEDYRKSQHTIAKLNENVSDISKLLFIPGCLEIQLNKECMLLIKRHEIAIHYCEEFMTDDPISFGSLIKKRYADYMNLNMDDYLDNFIKTYNIKHLILDDLDITTLDHFVNNKSLCVLKINNCGNLKNIKALSKFDKLQEFKINGKSSVTTQYIMKQLSQLPNENLKSEINIY